MKNSVRRIRLGKAIVSGRSSAIEIFDLYDCDHGLVTGFKRVRNVEMNALSTHYEAGRFQVVADLCKRLMEEYQDVCERQGGPKLEDFGGGRYLRFRWKTAMRMLENPALQIEPFVDKFYDK